LKGSEWNFTKYLPDVEDVEAACRSAQTFFSLPDYGSSDGEKEVHCFHSGFNRGVKWALDKHRLEKLKKALQKSLGLQSHYAESLNMYDRGGRKSFSTIEEWMDRLDWLEGLEEAEGADKENTNE
jgi:hypothetical protein